MTHKPYNYLLSLVEEFRKYTKETEWFEFKQNNAKPDEIGMQISALANSAAFHNKSYAYIIWGIEDDTHKIVGTSFSPSLEKIGNEELENWLLRLLKPEINFHFYEIQVDKTPIVIIEIPRASHTPIRFKNEEYIRIGSYTKKLKDFPEKERNLWKIMDQVTFESQVAAEHKNDDEVLKLLNYSAYFQTLNIRLPENRNYILDALEKDSLIIRSELNLWNITNLGAILFASELSKFKSLKRKTLRVILYKSNNRLETLKEYEIDKGYASGFETIISTTNNLLPTSESITSTFRHTLSMYPEIAIRELIANTLIHQDFFISGTGPLIEIFNNRLEITNPGKPLIDLQRLLDSPPRSRNESLASLMRRIGVCEERGSGIDKVVHQTEIHQLPPPLFEVVEDNTRIVLFAHQPLNKVSKNDRIRACYLHACLRYVSHDYMTNSSLRERFGIAPQNSAQASRIIGETVQLGLISLYDSKANRKYWQYVPYWAK